MKRRGKLFLLFAGLCLSFALSACPQKTESELEKQAKKTAKELEKLGQEAVKSGQNALDSLKR